jgi:predicted transcriptional regulator of viral defense system
MTIGQTISKYEAIHKYSFSKEEIAAECEISAQALTSALRRQKAKGKLVNIRKGFYLIIPPKYQLLGQLPLSLYVDSLFQWIGKPYYVSLLTAASKHGASHHAIHKDYITTSPPALRDIKYGSYNVEFFTKKRWPQNGIIQMNAEAGTYFVSSIALTLLDLINYQNKIGGLSRLSEVLQELSEELSPLDLRDTISSYGEASDIQRLAYLIEYFGAGDECLDIMIEWRNRQTSLNTVPLTPGKARNRDSIKNRWRVNVNSEIDIE